MKNEKSELNIYDKFHVMIDLETLSLNQNATIVQIGAVSFSFEKGIDRELLINVDPIDCFKNYKRHIDPKTVEWWKSQPKEIQNSWKTSPKPLKEALQHLNDFIGMNKNQYIWANGVAFDFGVLRSAYEDVKIERVWDYWNEMDARTAFNLVGWRNDKNRKLSNNYHNALEDAREQAKSLIRLFSEN